MGLVGLFSRAKPWMTAGASALVVAGCSAATAPAASPGFFPATYTGAMVVRAPLAKSAEVGPRKSMLRFRISVPTRQAYVVVVRCDTGDVEMSAPGFRERGPCDGSELRFTDNGCSGHKHTLTFRVSRPQSGDWGVALYTGPDVASLSCSAAPPPDKP